MNVDGLTVFTLNYGMIILNGKIQPNIGMCSDEEQSRCIVEHCLAGIVQDASIHPDNGA